MSGATKKVVGCQSQSRQGGDPDEQENPPKVGARSLFRWGSVWNETLGAGWLEDFLYEATKPARAKCDRDRLLALAGRLIKQGDGLASAVTREKSSGKCCRAIIYLLAFLPFLPLTLLPLTPTHNTQATISHSSIYILYSRFRSIYDHHTRSLQDHVSLP